METGFGLWMGERADNTRFGACLNAERAQPGATLHLPAISPGARDISLSDAKEEVETLLRGQFYEGRQGGHAARGPGEW